MRWPFARALATAAPPDPLPEAPEPARAARAEHPAWKLAEGTPVAEGRRVLRGVGGGSRYEVYLAWDERLFALVVVKLLRPHVAGDARALRELGREADLLGRLAHPGLVRGFGAVRGGPYPHLVLEHVEGPSLGKLVRRHGALSLDQLLPLALQLTAALQYLAAEGVAHLDVKPGNVVMGVPPRLIDLSIARPLEAAAALREPIGTDPYMAPEQCDPARWPGRVGPPADVWALGATLHHAARGEVPYPRARDARGRQDPLARFPQLAPGRPPPLPAHLPAAFRWLVDAMLAPEPGARPTAAEVASALGPLVLEVPARAPVSRRSGLPVAPSEA
jgi:serine/threonine protein kinase